MSTLTLLAEIALVACILIYLCLRFWEQKKNIDALSPKLWTEISALNSAREIVENGRAQKNPSHEIITALYQTVSHDSAVWKRLEVLRQHRQNTLGSLTTRQGLSAMLSSSGASRSGAATEDARFWAGAFVFIGLIGTLTCLGFAVFSLLTVIHRPEAGVSSSVAAGVRDVIGQMRSTFSSMGLAFLNTAAGVGLTVYLSGRINAYEMAAEAFRLDLEEFSLVELEPLFAIETEAVALSPATPLDEIKLESFIQRLESVSIGFSAGLQSALSTLELLQRGAQQTAAGLEAAAATFSGAADHLYMNTGTLNERLTVLSGTIERQEKSQQAWGQQTGATLTWLQEAVRDANGAFQQLDVLREALHEETAAHNMAIKETVQGVTGAFQKLDGVREALQKESTMHNAALQDAVRGLQEHGQRTADTSLRTFYELKTEMASGLARIEDAIRGGEIRQEQIVGELRQVLKTLGSYAEHVEDMLRSLPAAIGTEPILAYEDKSGPALGRMSQTLDGINSEVTNLHGDLSTHLTGAGAILQALSTKLENTEKGLAALHNGVAAANGRDGSRAAIEGIKADVSALAGQISTVDETLQGMAGAVSKLDRSVIFTWGRKGKGKS